MTTTTHTTSRTSISMWAGLALTLVCAFAPALDVALHGVIELHVRDAYPAWESELVSLDRNAIAGWLIVTNLLGIIGWVVTIIAARRERRWVFPGAVALLVTGLLLALMNVSMGSERYATIVPTPFAVLTLLPVVAGVVTVIGLARRRRKSRVVHSW